MRYKFFCFKQQCWMSYHTHLKLYLIELHCVSCPLHIRNHRVDVRYAMYSFEESLSLLKTGMKLFLIAKSHTLLYRELVWEWVCGVVIVAELGASLNLSLSLYYRHRKLQRDDLHQIICPSPTEQWTYCGCSQPRGYSRRCACHWEQAVHLW